MFHKALRGPFFMFNVSAFTILGMNMRLHSLLIGFAFGLQSLHAQQTIHTEVLVIGGTTGGIAAGIQSARLGVQTLIVEQTPWLGGMLTAAGVSCTDGNDELWSGLWMEFREALYKHYGTRNLFSGWVSETCFEPRVGDSIFKALAKAEKDLRVLHGWYFDRIIKKGKQVSGAEFVKRDGQRLRVTAKVTVDATDLGDGYASAGAAYDLGMEAASYSGEAMAPGTNSVIQDLTWAVVLEDRGKGSDHTIPMPPGYDSSAYFCCCTDAPCNVKPWNGDAQKMLDYGKLTLSPGKSQVKYMINWPKNGNDYYVNVVEKRPVERDDALLPARLKTLGFVYFLQSRLGYTQLAIADEFPTDHGLALMPYHREGRRLKGVVRLTVNHLTNPFVQSQPLYRTGIAVGDYPVDHHHAPEKNAPDIDFPRVPSFNVPLGALLPEKVEGMVVCEKGISVSNIVNGSTRLQPCVLLTGQAAGILAALSIQNNCQPRKVGVRAVQAKLVQANAYLMPYFDIRPGDSAWAAVQRVGATGILRGTGLPEGWANKTMFYPDSTMRRSELRKNLAEWYGVSLVGLPPEADLPVNMDVLRQEINMFRTGSMPVPPAEHNAPRIPMRRKEIAVWIDRLMDPFQTPVDITGKPIRK